MTKKFNNKLILSFFFLFFFQRNKHILGPKSTAQERFRQYRISYCLQNIIFFHIFPPQIQSRLDCSPTTDEQELAGKKKKVVGNILSFFNPLLLQQSDEWEKRDFYCFLPATSQSTSLFQSKKKLFFNPFPFTSLSSTTLCLFTSSVIYLYTKRNTVLTKVDLSQITIRKLFYR